MLENIALNNRLHFQKKMNHSLEREISENSPVEQTNQCKSQESQMFSIKYEFTFYILIDEIENNCYQCATEQQHFQ